MNPVCWLSGDKQGMAEKVPTNLNLINLLENVDGRLETVEKKYGAIESIDKRMITLGKDINKLWVTPDEPVKS